MSTKRIKLNEYEKIVLLELLDENEFEKFLLKNIAVDVENFKFEYIENEYIEDESESKNVFEYLSEIANIDIDNSQDKFHKYIGRIVRIVLFFVKSGINFLDLAQEASIFLYEAILKYDDLKIKLNLEDFINLHVIRKIVIYINEKYILQKFEIENYILKHKEHHKVHDNCNNTDCECVDYEKKLKLLKDKFDYFNNKNRLSPIKIIILCYFFGFNVDRRYSIFEIEKKFNINNCEDLFNEALYTLSTVENVVKI